MRTIPLVKCLQTLPHCTGDCGQNAANCRHKARCNVQQPVAQEDEDADGLGCFRGLLVALGITVAIAGAVIVATLPFKN